MHMPVRESLIHITQTSKGAITMQCGKYAEGGKIGCSVSMQEAQIRPWAGVGGEEGIKEGFQE